MKRPQNATCPMANRASRDGDGARLIDEGHLFLAPVKVGGGITREVRRGMCLATATARSEPGNSA
jgi:hypothetical protein